MNELYESLERVDQHIERVEEQRERVLELRHHGEDDTVSQQLLASFIRSYAVYEQRREHLLKRLLLAKAERSAYGALSL